MAATRTRKDGKPGGKRRQRLKPCPPAEKVVLPAGGAVEDALRVRGEDAVWGEVNSGSVELWFPGRAS